MQRHPRPAAPVEPGFIYGVLSAAVVGHISHHPEGIVAGEAGQQGVEELPITLAEVARADQLQGLAHGRVLLDPGHRVITAVAQLLDLLCGVAKEEEVLSPNAIADFDVGPIEGANRDRTIESHLHIAGAGSLLTSGGDLLREIHRRIHQLAQADAEVGQEHHLEAAIHGRIHVDHVGDTDQQADDQLGQGIARSRLATEHKGARRQVFTGADAQIALNDLQGRQVLALVFVDALDLHIKQGGVINQHPQLAAHVLGEALLAEVTHRLPALKERGVVGKGGKTLQLLEVGAPAIADRLI